MDRTTSCNQWTTCFRLVANGHSLRKTFGRQAYNMNSESSELALVKLMELFNHSSVAITKRYLGLRQEEILETYDCLTFWFFWKENIIHSHLFVKFVAIPIQQWQGRTFWTQRCYWNYLSFSNLANLNAVKIIAMAPHHWFVQPILGSYISSGVGYCFIHSKGNARAREWDKAISSHTFFFIRYSLGIG